MVWYRVRVSESPRHTPTQKYTEYPPPPPPGNYVQLPMFVLVAHANKNKATVLIVNFNRRFLSSVLIVQRTVARLFRQ